jgi:glycosyltransferase involved in cell wall biosynthesis
VAKRTPRVLHLATVDSTVRFMLLDQLRMLRRAGYDVTAMSAPGPWRAEIEDAEVPFIPWPSATRSWSPTADARAFSELVGVLRRERFDVVHTHNPKPGVLGRVAARITGTPVVVNTVHGLYAAPEDLSRARKVLLGVEWAAARFSHYELYQSAEDLARARRLTIASQRRSGFLGNGIDLHRFDPTRVDPAVVDRIRKEWEVPEGALVVGMVGRLVREKGWLEFVEAARRIRATRPDVVFVGIGPREFGKSDGLTDADMRGAGDTVRFCGEILEMPEALAALDVFALATYREGYPRAAIEAASMGLPLVLTDIRGCREVVPGTEHGILVPSHDPAALASALSSLLDDPRRRADIGRANRARARSEFDERRVVQRTLAVYDGLLKRLNGSLEGPRR